MEIDQHGNFIVDEEDVKRFDNILDRLNELNEKNKVWNKLSEENAPKDKNTNK